MLSIQAVCGLLRLRAPGIVPCVITFSLFPHGVIIVRWAQCGAYISIFIHIQVLVGYLSSYIRSIFYVYLSGPLNVSVCVCVRACVRVCVCLLGMAVSVRTVSVVRVM